jgi:D-3-phosphoglycerate dehydrogenase
VAETKRTTARDFTDLIRVTIAGGGEPAKVVGTTVGHHHRPHLLEAWGQRFDIQLESHVTLLRYTDAPGMIGRVGTVFGEQGVNIVSAAVGRLPDGADGEAGGGGAPEAIMALTTDGPVRSDVLEQIVASEGFIDGRTVAL